jgi:hypothetical protein
MKALKLIKNRRSRGNLPRLAVCGFVGEKWLSSYG